MTQNLTKVRLIGAIAQMGERLHGMQEVRGSSPLGSTKRIAKQDARHRSRFAGAMRMPSLSQ